MKLGIIFLAAASLVSCTPAGAPDSGTIEAGAGVANGVCSLIQGLTQNATVETICASVDEIAQVVAFVLTLRQAADAGAPPANACSTLPGTAVCATPREIGQGIELLVRTRAARQQITVGAK